MKQKNTIGNVTWLLERLPSVIPISRRCEADYYGASYLIAKTLGLKSVPQSLATWMHGAGALIFSDLYTPRQLLIEGTRIDRCLIHNKRQELFLRSRGFFRAHAIGAPILYVPETNTSRVKNSLLVMPAHSLYNTQHDWPFDSYAQYIKTLQPKFKTVVACIHDNDVQKGQWPLAFEKLGIPWMTGANSSDGNALQRLAIIFSSFEYMTTNTVGSQIPYASYFGCKVSVAGPKSEYRHTDFKGVPWYDRHQKIMHNYIDSMQRYLSGPRDPDFLVEPEEAGKHIEFAQTMLGFDCRRSPKEVAKLLGWNLGGQLELKVRNFLRRGIKIPRQVGKKILDRH